MGLPEVQMKFMQKATTAISRSTKGISSLILKDDTKAAGEVIYKGIEEVAATDWTADNYDYISKTFLGTPNKIIIERIAAAATDYNSALAILKNKKFNYLAIPGIVPADTANIATWIKTQRDTNHKTFKAILPNYPGDHEGIINFATEDIKVGEKVYTASQYTARIAGILAGLPFTRAATYFVLSEVESIKESTDPNADIDDGKLILINDGQNIKIASGVNSLKTLASPKGPDWKDILIIDKMDFNRDDITNTWEEEYVGKVINIYDNKILFINSVNAYFKTLKNQEEFFDPSSENKADINLEAQKTYLESQGTDTTNMKDQDILVANTGKKAFLNAHVKYTNAMQDLDFDVYM